ncbi:hypothetical protein ALC60_13517 [Trachymyrmex zeteki]|uniref:Uncharacterized protein n=1 Tax=Mycetomoellerius zeteki TaxID=64791 RepID=A0A151WHT1_9HYME|nr:hypothetical protein ALC60_13517 [Trachymyrmex zeteki]
MIDANKFPSLSHLRPPLSFSVNQGGVALARALSLSLSLSVSLTISRLRCPSLSRHSALRLSEERRKNSSGRWPPPASHRFIPLSHGVLFCDGDHREQPGEAATHRGPRSRCTGSLTATLTDGGGGDRGTGTRSHDTTTTTSTIHEKNTMTRSAEEAEILGCR